MMELKCYSYVGKALPPSCERIILSLGEEGAEIKYKLAKRIGLGNPTVNECMKILKGLELVKARKIGIARTGRPIRKFSLTLKGLVMFCKRKPSEFSFSSQMVDNIALRHASLLPEVLGKWDYFEDIGVKDTATRSFVHTMNNPPDVIYYLWDGKHRIIPAFETDEIIREKITVSFYLFPLSWKLPHRGPPGWAWTREKLQAWLNMLVLYEKIGRIIARFCHQREKVYSNVLENMGKLRTAIEQKDPSVALDHLPFGFLFDELLHHLKGFEPLRYPVVHATKTKRR